MKKMLHLVVGVCCLVVFVLGLPVINRQVEKQLNPENSLDSVSVLNVSFAKEQ
jgi:hypothetical protein